MLGIEKKCVTLRKMKECPMVSISTYEDLISINSELAKLFLCPENATDLISSICGGCERLGEQTQQTILGRGTLCL